MLETEKTKYILHICTLDKFIPEFIDFLRDEFPDSNNKIITIGDMIRYPYEPGKETIHFNSWLTAAPFLFRGIWGAKKVVVHGLFSNYLLIYLFLFFPFLKKCYWFIWGGDLYQFRYRNLSLKKRLKEQLRKFVISRFGFLVAFISGDIELARKWYSAKGEHVSCFMYPSNIVSIEVPKRKKTRQLTILVGNSADPENEHIKILQAIERKIKKTDNFRIVVPLSYGPKDHAQAVIDFGKSKFGKKFVALTNFMDRKKYIEFLDSCDVAVFGHKRQQAIGNTVALLGLGKKVYLTKNTVQWNFFLEHGIAVYDEAAINLHKISLATAERNSRKIQNLFSKERLTSDLKPIVTI